MPSLETSKKPSKLFTYEPAGKPSLEPSKVQSGLPTLESSKEPSKIFISEPIGKPSLGPSKEPSGLTSLEPSKEPSKISGLVYFENEDITADECAKTDTCVTGVVYICDDENKICVGDCDDGACLLEFRDVCYKCGSCV